MYREIIKIRITTTANSTTEDIYRVLLKDGEEQPLALVKARLNIGVIYFYTNKNLEVKHIELTHPLYKNDAIQTTFYKGENDPLLNLPRF